MIARLWRGLGKFLASARLAIGLITFVGIWSMIATVIPQESTSPAEVATWGAARPMLGPLVDSVGLHRAFSAPGFVIAIMLLALSSGVCAWRRTGVAARKSRLLRAAVGLDGREIAAHADVTLPLPISIQPDDALNTARGVLERLGIRTSRRGGILLAVSPWWSVWGSAVFHWALVALVVAVIAGTLLRSEGAMGIAEGDQRPDRETSYLSVETGRLHDWERKRRSIRVDAFDPSVSKNGVDLGAVPTLSVLDENGVPLITQQVYPNKKLHSGSLSIYSPACGLTVALSLASESGRDLGRVVQLVDFSQEASGGTVPVQPMVATNPAGQVLMRLEATVPLDDDPRGGFGEWIPTQPKARVVLSDGDGHVLYDGVLMKGQTVPVEGGPSITLEDIGWYASLVLVDDPTIPYVYASMILGMLGLALSVASRQQLVAVGHVDDAEGSRLAVRARLWRYVPTTVDEMRTELVKAFDREGGGDS